MRTVLLVIAIVLALIAAAIDFGWISVDEPHPLGWLALSFLVYLVTLLPWRDPRPVT